jgi:hypothetical protein
LEALIYFSISSILMFEYSGKKYQLKKYQNMSIQVYFFLLSQDPIQLAMALLEPLYLKYLEAEHPAPNIRVVYSYNPSCMGGRQEDHDGPRRKLARPPSQQTSWGHGGTHL